MHCVRRYERCATREVSRVSMSFDSEVEPSRTVQASKDECDVNMIMAKYQRTGLISHVSRYEGKYEDVASALPYQEALNIVMEADTVFKSLPSSLRSQFNNNPGEFLQFVQNPDNAQAMLDLGLREAPSEPPAPVPVIVTNSPPQTPS